MLAARADDPGAACGQGDLVSRLRAVIGAKDEQIAVLTASLEAALAALEGEREVRRRLELRLAEVERRLSMDSTDSGRLLRRSGSARRRSAGSGRSPSGSASKDRRRGGQPGHQGKGLRRDPDPGRHGRTADPPAECRSCRASLDGAAAAGSRWAQVIDAEIIRTVTEWTCCRACVPVLRDCYVRGAACGRARGFGVLRAGAERRRGAAGVLRERAAGAVRAGHRHAARASRSPPAGWTRPPPGSCAAGEGRVR